MILPTIITKRNASIQTPGWTSRKRLQWERSDGPGSSDFLSVCLSACVPVHCARDANPQSKSKHDCGISLLKISLSHNHSHRNNSFIYLFLNTDPPTVGFSKISYKMHKLYFFAPCAEFLAPCVERTHYYHYKYCVCFIT